MPLRIFVFIIMFAIFLATILTWALGNWLPDC